jgi:transposase
LIRVEAVWLAVEPLDLRAGMESVLNRVVTVFGAARPHHAYLFSNRRANRMKVLVHWVCPGFPDTEIRWEDDLGGVRWADEGSRRSSSSRR